MKYPDYKTYEVLYAHFIKKDKTKQLLDLAGDLKGKILLDICCGNGRLTTSALKRKAKKVIMIDNEIEMVPHTFWGEKKIEVKIGEVKEKLKQLLENESDIETNIDIAICQQGVNYWLTKTKAKLLSMTMNDNGMFIFNTFNKKPKLIPQIKEYYKETPIDLVSGRSYVEVSWIIGDDVHHVQICSGIPPHFTKFKWFSREDFTNILDEYFTIKVLTEGNTDIYKCIKKKQPNE